jgi:hypothetical protein
LVTYTFDSHRELVEQFYLPVLREITVLASEECAFRAP